MARPDQLREQMIGTSKVTMNYPVMVKRSSDREYTAEPLGKPELKTAASTEAEALAQAEKALEEWMSSGKIVGVEVSGTVNGNPWLDAWGRSADDPDFDEYLAEIEKARAAAEPT